MMTPVCVTVFVRRISVLAGFTMMPGAVHLFVLFCESCLVFFLPVMRVDGS